MSYPIALTDLVLSLFQYPRPNLDEVNTGIDPPKFVALHARRYLIEPKTRKAGRNPAFTTVRRINHFLTTLQDRSLKVAQELVHNM